MPPPPRPLLHTLLTPHTHSVLPPRLLCTARRVLACCPHHAAHVAEQELWFTGIAFITNVFFIPFMALRALPEPLEEQQPAAGAAAARAGGAGALAAQQPSMRPRRVPVPGSQRLPGWSPVLGGLGMFMGEAESARGRLQQC